PVVAAGRQADHRAHQTDAVTFSYQSATHRTFLLDRPSTSLNAFFATSNSSVSRPITRSSSAMRASAGSARCSRSNSLGALARNWAFQRENISSLSWYSRQTSAAVRRPLRTSNTSFDLNSELNCRRGAIALLLLRTV